MQLRTPDACRSSTGEEGEGRRKEEEAEVSVNLLKKMKLWVVAIECDVYGFACEIRVDGKRKEGKAGFLCPKIGGLKKKR